MQLPALSVSDAQGTRIKAAFGGSWAGFRDEMRKFIADRVATFERDQVVARKNAEIQAALREFVDPFDGGA